MKKHLLKSLLALALVLISGSAWGKTYSLTPDQESTEKNSTSYITTLTEFTYQGIKWEMNQWNPSTLQIRTNQSSAASEFRFYNTSAFPGKITKVVITFSALTVSDASKLMFVGGTSEVTATTGGTAGTLDSTKKTLTWTPGSSDNFTFFAFYQNGKAASGYNYLAASDAIVVTYELDANKTNTSISFGAMTDFEILQTEAFTAPKATLTAGEATLTGKTITYASSNEDVATVASDGTVTIVRMGKTAITATFAGDDDYNGSNASYDLTVVGVFTSLADARTAQGTSTAENVIQMTFTNVRVTAVSGSSVTITDDVTTAIIYQSGHGFEVGNILNGTVRCTMIYYNSGSLFEFKGITKTSEGLNVTSTAAIWDLSSASYEASSSEIVTWISSFATMSNSKGASSTSVNNYLGGDANDRTSSRFYTDNVLTITPSNGYAISSVLFTATTAGYATALANSAWTNATATASSTTVTVTPTDGKVAISAVIGGTCGFTNVIVYYEQIPPVDVIIYSAGWATAYLPFQAAMPTGVTAYIINGTTGENGLTLTEITGDIPANTGVLLKGAAGTVTFTPSSGTAADVSDNMLVGTADASGKTFNETGMKYYILANDPDKYGLGFYFQTAGGSSVTCAQYKAVLAVPAGSSSAIGFRLDGATMIDAVQAAAKDAVIYDLTGRRVENPARGIYNVNGKKVLMK
ncbi:MAG: Ig-like domain-containing protein [Bacteroidaceae bacterium]|nr:Ig-like domain-containing protein [Bacteroidaceae bacterium]